MEQCPSKLAWWTALEYAGLPELKALLASGFSVDTRNYIGDTALQAVLRNRRQENVDVIKLLLAHGARVNDPDPISLQPLYLAIKAGWAASVVQDVLDHGVDLVHVLRCHPDLLNRAVRNSNPSVVEVLLDAGVDPNTPGGDGRSALDVALRNATASALLLIQKGADVHHVELGESKLFLAVRQAKPDAMLALLARGADPCFVSQEGVSVLDHALPDYQDTIRAAIEQRRLEQVTPAARAADRCRRI